MGMDRWVNFSPTDPRILRNIGDPIITVTGVAQLADGSTVPVVLDINEQNGELEGAFFMLQGTHPRLISQEDKEFTKYMKRTVSMIFPYRYQAHLPVSNGRSGSCLRAK